MQEMVTLLAQAIVAALCVACCRDRSMRDRGESLVQPPLQYMAGLQQMWRNLPQLCSQTSSLTSRVAL